MKTTCPEHKKLNDSIIRIEEKVKFIYQDARERKDRYEKEKDRKEKRKIWFYGVCLSVFLTVVTFVESIRIYIKEWLSR